MKSFEPGFLETHPLSHDLMRILHLLGEYKGKQDLYKKQYPQILETMRMEAVIHSTESSNRIEGVVAPLQRIKSLVDGKTQPQNRPEQEIAGYKDVLNTIHEQWKDMDFTPNVILQMHRDLFKYTDRPSGQWKSSQNLISEDRPDGSKHTRFTPVEPFLTPEYMRLLHEYYHQEKSKGNIAPLLLIASYVIDFLCIHPFFDGNGRMARLIALLLLYKEGYEVGRYISLETCVEKTKDSYYSTLYKSDQGWYESQHNLLPWWEYFLGVMLLKAYKEFETRAGEQQTAKGAKSEAVEAAIRRLPMKFTVGDIEAVCPYVAHATIQRTLQKLRTQGVIRLVGMGRFAQWEKTR